MAENWPWETSHKTQYSSPLQSGSSQSSQEATAAIVRQTQQQQQQQHRPTVVETLQAYFATAAAPTTSQPGRSLSDPSGGVTAAPTVRQSRSSGALSGSTVGMKRRSRTSRRMPPTVVEATSSDFKETVHRLTGIAPPAPQPVRPQAKRAAPATPFIRPSAATPDSSPQLLSSLLNVTAGAPAVHPAIWHELQQRMGAPSSPQPQFDPFIKNEEFGAPSSTSMPLTWWDTAPQSYGLMNPSITAAAFDASMSPGGRILEDDPELSMDDPDLSWFQPDHPASDYMR